MNDERLFRSRSGLILLIVAGGLLIAGLFQSATPPQPQDGPRGSSYATHSAGTAALADLLERNGYEVSRMRRPVAELRPGPEDVVVLVQGGTLEPDDLETLNEFISSGGRFVAIESDLDGIVAVPPSKSTATSAIATSLLSVGPFHGVVTATPGMVWADPGSLLPMVGSQDGVLVGMETRAEGIVVALSDATIVENDEIDRADHALLALDAIGDTTGTVRFIEYVHGFTRPTGLAALPDRWKQAFAILAVAGVIWLVARGTRFGPVEETDRSLPPPRSAYVDALALTLAAGKDPDAGVALDEAIVRELRRRGITPGSPEAVDTAVASGVDRGTAELALSASSREDGIHAKSVLLSQLVNKEQL